MNSVKNTMEASTAEKLNFFVHFKRVFDRLQILTEDVSLLQSRTF